MRAPYQVLVIPFIRERKKDYYAVFRRKDLDLWQFIAGGGEGGESPLEAAKREFYEETSVDKGLHYIRLASTTTIPAVNTGGLRWGKIIMIPEITFGVRVLTKEFKIGGEHVQYLWLSKEEAMGKLRYDSNKSALWELDYRLKNDLNGIEKNLQAIKKFLE